MKNLSVLFFAFLLTIVSFSDAKAINSVVLKQQIEDRLDSMDMNEVDAISEYQDLQDTLDMLEGGRCYGRNNFFRKAGRAIGGASVRNITLCGERIDVPAWMYVACQGALAAIPAGCTVGTVATAGTACAAAIATSSVACGASVATITRVARACVGL